MAPQSNGDQAQQPDTSRGHGDGIQQTDIEQVQLVSCIKSPGERREVNGTPRRADRENQIDDNERHCRERERAKDGR